MLFAQAKWKLCLCYEDKYLSINLLNLRVTLVSFVVKHKILNHKVNKGQHKGHKVEKSHFLYFFGSPKLNSSYYVV